MPWRFRKSFTPIPGVRLTLSPGGISTSVGAGPFRLTVGPRGTAVTARIPGTGISFRQPLFTPKSGDQQTYPAGNFPAESPPQPQPSEKFSFTPSYEKLQPIESADSSVLTSPGLEEFKEVLATAHTQYGQISTELAQAEKTEARAVGHYTSWANGFLLKRLRKKKFAELEAAAQESTAQREELVQQLELSRLRTTFDMPDSVAIAFDQVCKAFQAVIQSKAVWQNMAFRPINYLEKFVERTVASMSVDRKPAQFRLQHSEVIETEIPVPCLPNAKGGTIYLFPAFVVYFASATHFALIELSDLDLRVDFTNFHETNPVPTDAEQVGHTWFKANKDGSRDKRFSGNYQIPVMRYAQLNLRSEAGLNEEYLISNYAATLQFEEAWRTLSENVAAVQKSA